MERPTFDKLDKSSNLCGIISQRVSNLVFSSEIFEVN